MDEPGRRRDGGYQVSYGETDQEGGETRSKMGEKSQLLIEYYTPCFNLQKTRNRNIKTLN